MKVIRYDTEYKYTPTGVSHHTAIVTTILAQAKGEFGYRWKVRNNATNEEFSAWESELSDPMLHDEPPRLDTRGALPHEVTIISADHPIQHGVVEGNTIRVTAEPAQQERRYRVHFIGRKMDESSHHVGHHTEVVDALDPADAIRKLKESFEFLAAAETPPTVEEWP